MNARPGYTLEPADGVQGLLARVDLDHRFYFDHALTHLPGLLLVDMGLAAIARQTGGGRRQRPWFKEIEAVFRSISALQQPPEIEVRAEEADRYHCVLAQGGRVRAEVVATALGDMAGMAGAAAYDKPPCHHTDFNPVPRNLVRKVRAENVFIGQGGRGDLAAVRPPASTDSSLGAVEGGRYSQVYLLECFLQLCRASRGDEAAEAAGVPPSREVLTVIRTFMPRAIAAREALKIGFRPDVATGHFTTHPKVRHRTARLFSGGEMVGRFSCGVLDI